MAIVMGGGLVAATKGWEDRHRVEGIDKSRGEGSSLASRRAMEGGRGLRGNKKMRRLAVGFAVECWTRSYSCTMWLRSSSLVTEIEASRSLSIIGQWGTMSVAGRRGDNP